MTITLLTIWVILIIVKIAKSITSTFTIFSLALFLYLILTDKLTINL